MVTRHVAPVKAFGVLARLEIRELTDGGGGVVSLSAAFRLGEVARIARVAMSGRTNKIRHRSERATNPIAGVCLRRGVAWRSRCARRPAGTRTSRAMGGIGSAEKLTPYCRELGFPVVVGVLRGVARIV